MGISGSKQLLEGVDPRSYRAKYIDQNRAVINAYLKNDDPIALSFLRSIVFPVNGRWSDPDKLEARFEEAEKIMERNPEVIPFYNEHKELIQKRLTEWNSVASASRTVLRRKIEQIPFDDTIGIDPILEFGLRFFDFVLMCSKHPKTPIIRLIRGGVEVMVQRKWQGKVTPRICLLGIKSKEQIKQTSRLKEESFG